MPPFDKEAWIGSRELIRKAENLQRGGKKQKHRRTVSLTLKKPSKNYTFLF